MRGQHALIAMRSKGYAPRIVWFDLEPDRLPMADDWQHETPAHAHLQLEPHDRIATLDLRCLVGLTVAVSGPDAEKVRRMADACKEASAGRVIAYCGGDYITDTAGHLHG
jgi:hypothetical protein